MFKPFRIMTFVKFLPSIILLGVISGCISYRQNTESNEKYGTESPNTYKSEAASLLDTSTNEPSVVPISTNESSVLRISTNESTIQQELPGSEVCFFNKPKNNIKDLKIEIYKKDRKLELYSSNRIIGRFKIALGSHPEGSKNVEGDARTPEGSYYVCTRNEQSKFTRFLGLSYPGIDDAKRGLKNKLIDQNTYKSITDAVSSNKRPPWDTPLGGVVGIHGGGTSSDWTIGCIALSDNDIMILWEYVGLNTIVKIYP